MLYEFELDYNASEETKNICNAKDEGVVDYSTVTRSSSYDWSAEIIIT